jgi:hypothetical protein
MDRRSFLMTMAAGVLASASAGAARAEVAESVAERLRAEGYRDVRVERTLLGRIRITAERDGRRREIVIDRGSGEILRDLTVDAGGGAPSGGDAPR